VRPRSALSLERTLFGDQHGSDHEPGSDHLSGADHERQPQA
jgi:hypothetical protein